MVEIPEGKVKVRFVFHTPKGERGVGKLIVAWTWIRAFVSLQWKCLKYNFSHEELWIPNEDGLFEVLDPEPRHCGVMGWDVKYAGQCFSSTTRGGAKGVRFAPASAVLKHPERWRYIECEVDDYRYEVGMEEAKKLVGAKYDYWAIILGFTSPFPIQHSKQWYCSEICDWLKYLWRLILKRHKQISPRWAAYLLAKVWGEPKPLKGE